MTCCKNVSDSEARTSEKVLKAIFSWLQILPFPHFVFFLKVINTLKNLNVKTLPRLSAVVVSDSENSKGCSSLQNR